MGPTAAALVVLAINIAILTTSATRNGRNGQIHGVSNNELIMLLTRNGTMDPNILRNYTPTTPVPSEVQCHVRVKRGPLGDVNLNHYNVQTVSPPALEEAECFVAVSRTDNIGGRCIPLGAMRMPACQAGANLDPFNQECQQMSGRRRGRGRNRGGRRLPRRRHRNQ